MGGTSNTVTVIIVNVPLGGAVVNEVCCSAVFWRLEAVFYTLNRVCASVRDQSLSHGDREGGISQRFPRIISDISINRDFSWCTAAYIHGISYFYAHSRT